MNVQKADIILEIAAVIKIILLNNFSLSKLDCVIIETNINIILTTKL